MPRVTSIVALEVHFDSENLSRIIVGTVKTSPSILAKVVIN